MKGFPKNPKTVELPKRTEIPQIPGLRLNGTKIFAKMFLKISKVVLLVGNFGNIFQSDTADKYCSTCWKSPEIQMGIFMASLFMESGKWLIIVPGQRAVYTR